MSDPPTRTDTGNKRGNDRGTDPGKGARLTAGKVRQHLLEQLETHRQLAMANSGDALAQHRLFLTYCELGHLALKEGDLPAIMPYWRKAEAIIAQLANGAGDHLPFAQSLAQIRDMISQMDDVLARGAAPDGKC